MGSIKFKFADIMNVELQQSKLKSHSNSYKINKILHNQQHYKLLNKFTGFSMKTTPRRVRVWVSGRWVRWLGLEGSG